MLRLPTLVLLGGLFVLSGGLMTGQDARKDEPKPKTTKAKGFLPQNWGKIGLTDDQKQEIYKIQGRHNTEIDKLEAKIKELKATRDKEMRSVLSADQKKKLEDILLGKDN